MPRRGETALMDLVGRIYEAALGEDQWPAVLQAFARLVNASCGALVAVR